MELDDGDEMAMDDYEDYSEPVEFALSDDEMVMDEAEDCINVADCQNAVAYALSNHRTDPMAVDYILN